MKLMIETKSKKKKNFIKDFISAENIFEHKKAPQRMVIILNYKYLHDLFSI